MRVEISRVANGYMVMPPYDERRGECFRQEDIHVFETYRALVEHLQGILDRSEPKKASL